MALAKKGLDLLKVTRWRGNPILQPADAATLAKRDKAVERALKLKRDYPLLNQRRIAALVNQPPGTLKDWIADYRRRYPESG